MSTRKKNNSSQASRPTKSITKLGEAKSLHALFPKYSETEPLIELGKIVGVWGVKGWIKVHSYTRKRQGIGKYKQWILQPAGKGGADNQIVAEIDQCRVQGKSVVAKFSTLDDRNHAESLNGYKVFIKSSQLPSLPKGEFYWYELVGLNVMNTQGDALGKVIDMMETGANDVFVVKGQTQDEKGEPTTIERLIPQTEDVVVSVDTSTKVLTVEWDKDFLV